MDATHKATINSSTLLPIDVEQFEKYRSRTVETELRFDPGGVERHREVSTSKSPPKWKRVNFPSIRDVIGSMLYVRSQPLANGDEIGLVSFPADAPYFVLVTVEGHETVHCMDKEMPAIRLGISVRKLEVEHKEPVRAVNYSKFKSGTAWVSDDSLRLPLRAEVKVFVGFVYGELVDYELVDGSPKTE